LRTAGLDVSISESEDALLTVARPSKERRRPLRRILLALATQYVIIATIVGLSVAATLHYLVTPQVVAQFEAIEAALKRVTPRL
jgi:hypothetical protein